MITCNRCGTVNTAGMLNCQVCGTPLAGKVENELNTRGQNQPALPAWLETLHAGDRSVAPANIPMESRFSAADLLNEGTLPSWMHSGRADQQESASPMQGMSDRFTGNPYAQGNFSQSGTQPALRPSALPGPNTGDEGLPPRAITANSLIDERSLPSWMQKESKNVSQEQPNNISAASLLQPDALPEWMRSISPQQEAPVRTDSQSFAAFNSSAPLASSSPMQAPVRPEATGRAPQGLTAGDLIDPQALPSWMSQENNRGGNASGMSAQAGVPASSLLDSDALPPWLRQGGQNQAPRADNPATTNPPQRPSSGVNYWPPAPSPIQPSAQGQMGSISASSFIDASVLPEWMRSGNGGQQAQAPGAGRPGVYGNPQSRVENMRVPSRPRNELNPTDNSEMAANVFASMLGVASSSPQYPGQPGSSPLPPQAQQGGAYASQPQMPQGGQPFSAPTGMSSGIYNQVPATPQTNMAQPSSFAPPAYGTASGYQGNMAGAYSGSMSQNMNPYGNPANMPQNMNPYGNPASAQTAYPGGAAGAAPIFPNTPAVGDQKSAKPAKRSIFEALRDLIFR